uniref:Uncharacterized protein n=1 Tax=uncultured marine virus TaxID=186617 RepID=A0A0F7L4X4_9VIRU|nr:hypothetical protein [uncultured marine virus]
MPACPCPAVLFPSYYRTIEISALATVKASTSTAARSTYKAACSPPTTGSRKTRMRVSRSRAPSGSAC